MFEVHSDPGVPEHYRIRFTCSEGTVLAELGPFPTIEAVKAAISRIREMAAQAHVVDLTARVA
ncbi:hypothetical protein [Sinomonas halotolerans]|uniref:DUF1508 domain-containing protein n=1 Tax=Sinomonas halotolerans TaxID=1644133 RepID=A0ABU9X1J2_9MICC